MRKKIFLWASLVFLPLFYFLLSPSPALAMRIFPTRQTVVVSTEKQQILSFFVTNESAEKKDFQGEFQAFSLDQSTGATRFHSNDPLLSFFEIKDTSISLQPGETGQFTASFTAPAETLPGSYYFVFFIKEVGLSESEIGIAHRVGSLVFLHIEGVVQESFTIRDFSTSQLWYFHSQPKVHFLAENTGNIHFVPRGEVIINGRKQDLNPLGSKVLARGSWEQTWTPEMSFRDIGQVSVRVVGAFGLDGQTFVRDISFWYLPWEFMVPALLILIATLFGFFWWRKKYKL